jgi:prepilin signal peptidase PulO-like enzyme (type II secretory pathway)
LAAMTVRSARLGLGEWLAGIGSAVLLVDLFAAAWFEYRPQYHALAAMLNQRSSANGWQTFEVIGPLALIVALLGIVICLLTATRRSPALPVVLTTLLAPVSLILAVVVAVRVLLDQPTVRLAQASGGNVIEARAGAYVGLVSTVAIFAGLYLSLRRDSVAAEDAPAALETLRI